MLDVTGNGDARLVCVDLGTLAANSAKVITFRNCRSLDKSITILSFASDTSLQRWGPSNGAQHGERTLRISRFLHGKRRASIIRVGRGCWFQCVHLQKYETILQVHFTIHRRASKRTRSTSNLLVSRSINLLMRNESIRS